MLHLRDFRTKLLAQRRDLFRQAAPTDEDLLWLRQIWRVKPKSEGRQKQWFGK
jgi:hypothetical protein